VVIDLALDDLGGDLQHLEEVGLSGVAAGGAGRNHHVHRGDGADTGGGRHAVGKNHVAHLGEVVVGEHESHVAGHLVLDVLVEVAGVGLQEISQDLSHQGVLAHQNLGLSAHVLSGQVHLLGADVIDTHDEHLVVCGEHTGHLDEVLLLLIFGQRHD